MRAFEDLTYKGQVRRLRRLAEDALRQHGLDGARLTFIDHCENTTFRIDDPRLSLADTTARYRSGRCLLRIHRPGYQSRDNILSELMWLDALADADFAVPRPRPTPSGDKIVEATAVGVPEARLCTLMRWVEGRFAKKNPNPSRYEALGALMATLHNHAAAWTPPLGFDRGRWDSARLFDTDAWESLDPADRAPLETAAGLMTQAMDTLGNTPEAWGLLHSDLHFGNVLFTSNEARAIDFDDCAYGHWLYDIATTLSGDCESPRWDAIEEGLLTGYRRHRPIDEAQLAFLDVFMVGRRISLVLWAAERSRDNPMFKERLPRWIKWARALIDARLTP